jgi:hypothetical protein
MHPELKNKLKAIEKKTGKEMTALRLLLAEPGGHFNLTEDFSAIHFAVAWHAYVDARNKAARHLWFSKRQMCYADRQLTPEEDAEMAQIPCQIAESLSKIHPNVVVTDDGDIRAHTVYFSLPSGAGNTLPTGRIVMD